MSWAKFDDRYDDHRKIKRAWKANRGSIGLHAMAITYCTRHATDGIVDDDWLMERLPAKPERQKVLAVLVDCGLFEQVDGGYRVHDFLEYNASKEARSDLRHAARNAARIRWEKADRTANGNAPRSAVAQYLTPPHPTTPIKTPLPPVGGGPPDGEPIDDTAPPRPSGKRERELKAWRERMAAWGAAHFPDAEPGAVSGAVSWLARGADGAVSVDDLGALGASDDVWGALLGARRPTQGASL